MQYYGNPIRCGINLVHESKSPRWEIVIKNNAKNLLDKTVQWTPLYLL
jgi:hypothetical protein